MIQFALLYGLGFLSATLLVMVLAPAVHRRVVRYTENRLKATMPISPSEVRAQRDMARAVYAAENARTRQELTEERDSNVSLQLRFDRLSEEASKLHAGHHELQMQIGDMSVEAADLRSRLRREEGMIQQLKQALRKVEDTVTERDGEIETLRKRIQKLTSDLDHLNIEISTRDTTSDNLAQRVSALREERDALRTDLKLMTTRAKDAEQRLTLQEGRVARLEETLGREIAEKADTQEALERRLLEINQLRGRTPSQDGDWREPVIGSYPLPRRKVALVEKRALTGRMRGTTQPTVDEEDPSPIDRSGDAMSDLGQYEDEIRTRSSALSAELTRAPSAEADDALRRELAAMAADMVALTVVKEGPTSPIIAILERDTQNGAGDDIDHGNGDENDRPSLAVRARRSIARLEARASDA